MSQEGPGTHSSTLEVPSSYQANRGIASTKQRLVKKKKRKQNDGTSSIISLPVSSVSAFSGFTAVSNNSSMRPKRSKTSLFTNGFVMFGREYCYAIEASLTTPILLSIGLPVHLYSLVWVISPILGFVLQPIIGNMSDRCRLRWGRRRPFILILAILLILGMTFFLNGEQFVRLGAGSQQSIKNGSLDLSTILVTVAGVVVFDFSADFIEGPIRAYVMDVCDKDDIKIGLYYQAIFTGMGGALGYASGGVSWVRDLGFDDYFPTDQQVVYVFAAVIFVSTVAMNLISIPEKSWVGEITHSKKLKSRGDKVRKQPNKKSGTVIEEVYGSKYSPDSSSIEKYEVNNNSDASNVKNIVVETHAEGHRNSMPSEIIHSRTTRKVPPMNKRQKRKIVSADIYGTFDARNLAEEIAQGLQQRGRIANHNLGGPGPNNTSRSEKKVSQASAKRTAHWINESKRSSNSSTKYLTDRRLLPHLTVTPAGISNESDRLIGRQSDSDSSQSSDSSSTLMSPPPLKVALQQKLSKYSGESSGIPEVESALLSAFEERHPYRPLPFAQRIRKDDARRAKVTLTKESARGSGKLSGVKGFLISIYKTPKEIKLLCVAHLFGWMGFLCVALFFTDFVGQEVFGGDPQSPLGTTRGDAYKQGVEIGSWGMAINAAASSAYCFLLKPMIQRFGARVTYVFGYFAFALGAAGMAIFRTVTSVLILSSLIGVMSATLYTLPYFLISKYHEGYKRLKGTPEERGVGADCALVTCMIQLAQIIVGLGIGGLVTWLETATVTVAAASVISLIGSVYVMFWVKY